MRIAKNHPLPDGNKRVAWQALTLFCVLNGRQLEPELDDAVDLMIGIAGGDIDEAALAEWLTDRLTTAE